MALPWRTPYLIPNPNGYPEPRILSEFHVDDSPEKRATPKVHGPRFTRNATVRSAEYAPITDFTTLVQRPAPFY